MGEGARAVRAASTAQSRHAARYGSKQPPFPPWDTVARLTSEPDRSSIEATPSPAGKRRRNGCTCRRALPAHAIGARVEEIECSPELDASAGRSHREAQPLLEQPASRRAPPHSSPPRPRRGPDRKSRVAGVRFRDASKPRASRPSLEDRGGGLDAAAAHRAVRDATRPTALEARLGLPDVRPRVRSRGRAPGAAAAHRVADAAAQAEHAPVGAHARPAGHLRRGEDRAVEGGK